MAASKTTSTRKPHARRIFMEELALLREESGMSLAQLAERVRFDRSYLHKLETGLRLGDEATSRALDQCYGTGRHLQLLWKLAKEEVFLDRYKRFMKLEAEANVRNEYVASTIPGLLQTEEYAREQLRTALPKDEEQLEERVAARIGRQTVLTQVEPLHLRAIIDESALLRRLRDPSAWTRQLAHLLEAASRHNVTIQVLPFSAGLQYLLGGSLTILWMPNGTSIAYEESSTTGDLMEEPGEVEHLKLSYDRLRDAALTPVQSVAFLRSLMEDNATCEPSDRT
ncbi:MULTISPECIES: helix-turn-helix domain-containing protein [Streptomyces]|jgi:transcriptional regulator with XRE-family HTH domain|uniref:helix-turn-helix domain-containing protein n=1 Tax=Streptomyces TaxID=1883 RepID=UPI001F1774EF|nr:MULTISPECIES: helix-turn-helix transcriptional regulator [unclassified Streptomyces]MCU4748547.1 helix-turn-helix domain-containing protein [Streptomyces sp. G-5]